MDALLYNIFNDPYYRDVWVDYNGLDELPEIVIEIWQMIKFITLLEIDNNWNLKCWEGYLGLMIHSMA